MWQKKKKTEVIPVIVGALGRVKKGMVKNIKKVSERAWDLHESLRRCLVH